jgi:kynureninase
MSIDLSKSFAKALDEKDALASFRGLFHIPDPDLIYADGNSLGRLPLKTLARMKEILEQEWGMELIRGWNKGWFEAPRRVGEKVAHLIGASRGQTIVCDSTSVNLYKLTLFALSMRPGRDKVVSDDLNFPSDLYVLQGALHQSKGDHHLHLVPSGDGISMDEDVLIQAIDERTALVTLSHVAFKSGFLYDIEKIAKQVKGAGAIFLVDLSHSVGVVPIELNRWGVDMAVGCTYKYLNGGPGSPAFLYVNQAMQESGVSPIWGWMGQSIPFDFALDYTPSEGITKFLIGTPPILSLLALDPALDIVINAGIEVIRDKSTQLTTYFIQLVEEKLTSWGFQLGSPKDPDRRGSHVSLRHPEGYRINKALIQEMAIIPDFREPDHIRFGLAPLYTSFQEVWQIIENIKQVMVEKRYEKYSEVREVVT